jgi:hypothetical protein
LRAAAMTATPAPISTYRRSGDCWVSIKGNPGDSGCGSL